MCIIAPSLLEADYKCLGEQLKTMEKSGICPLLSFLRDGIFSAEGIRKRAEACSAAR